LGTTDALPFPLFVDTGAYLPVFIEKVQAHCLKWDLRLHVVDHHLLLGERVAILQQCLAISLILSLVFAVQSGEQELTLQLFDR